MKKILALILSVIMVVSLAACGSQSNATEATTQAAPEAETTAAESTSKEEASESETTEAPTEGINLDDVEEMQLLFPSSKNENSEIGNVIKHFCDYVTEASGGKITFNVMWGGSFCSMREEFDNVSSGAADICALNPLPLSAQLPLAQLPNGTTNGYAGTTDYAREMLFENDTTSTLIQNSFEANGLHYVGFSINGNSGYYCTFEARKLEDMAGMKFGTGQSGALQKEYGLNIISMETRDGYDNLSRGVVDCADSPMPNAYASSWQEVTDYWVFYHYVTFGNIFSINLEKWNSFSETTKKIFEDAGQDAADYATKYIEEFENDIITDVEKNNSVTVTWVDDEMFADKNFQINVDNSLAKAANAGATDDMKTIIKAAADYLGFDASEVLAKY